MRAVPLLLALALAGLAGCRSDPPPVPPPDADRIGRDLVGTRFVFFEDEEGAKYWTIEEGEVKAVRLVDGVASSDGSSYRARVDVTLAAPNRTIRGDLHATYRRRDGAWAFDQAVRADERNFAVEEIAAILYAAEPAGRAPGDSLYDPRDVRLEPIARYAEGTYTAPFAPYEDEIRAVLDADYEVDEKPRDPFEALFGRHHSRRDSLREAAVSGLAGRIAARYFNRTWTLFLLEPGETPMPVRVRARRAGFDGCRSLDGTVRAPSPSAAQTARLATTSSTMGGRVALGRPLTSAEERAFVRLAHDRFRQHGVPPERLGRLRADRLYAADLDGDGIESWIGGFSVGGASPKASAVYLVLVVATPGGTPRVLLDRYASFADGSGRLDLVGVVDVDGDRRAEVVLREAGYESHRYRILSRPDGAAWETVFEGGGGGC